MLLRREGRGQGGHVTEDRLDPPFTVIELFVRGLAPSPRGGRLIRGPHRAACPVPGGRWDGVCVWEEAREGHAPGDEPRGGVDPGILTRR